MIEYFSRTALAAATLASFSGCGGPGEAGPRVYPVSGKVLIDGKPADKARISFHASGAAVGPSTPYAVSGQDGSFRPTTILAEDGAPAGEYSLSVIWPAVTVDHGEEVDGPDRLRGAYNNPQTSGLKATIKEGANELPPLELKTRR
ncbi:hypothetical protein [Singulisphaera sp. PoT]|uniref:hypothetical protein n=1 Tax=Singulisphaera sp. PoT TaxID=3411797 RepID=UPI003BF60655